MADVITQQYLQEILNYDSESGLFIWSKPICGRIKVGQIAGTIHQQGYIKIQIKSKVYAAHRLAFLYMTGNMPLLDVDHINRNTSDNRFSNLRLCSPSENSCNRELPTISTSGIKGLSYHSKDKAWVARVMIEGRTHRKTIKATENCENTKRILTEWLVERRKELHGEFARHE